MNEDKYCNYSYYKMIQNKVSYTPECNVRFFMSNVYQHQYKYCPYCGKEIKLSE